MDYKNASFTASYARIGQLPGSARPEISFVGRSNVGKSSLMNAILDRKGLVKVSSKPGCTQAVNFFRVGKIDFVDLPGYGFARVSKSEKERWHGLIDGYFEQKRRHTLCVLLVDIRHEAKKLDIQMVEFLKAHDIPFMIAFTKADKISKSQVQRQVGMLCKELSAAGDVIVQPCSSTKKDGIKEMRAIIDEYVAGNLK